MEYMDAYRVRKLTEALLQRLGPLGEVDAMKDNEKEHDVKQLRYKFLSVNATNVPGYWAQAMPPCVTREPMAAVDARIRASAERLARAEECGCSAARLERWWHEQQLPTSMGGMGVGGHEAGRGARYAATLAACWPDLLEHGTLLTASHLCEAAEAAERVAAGGDVGDALPMLVDFCASYEAIRVERDRIAAVYDDFKKHEYTTVRAGKLAGYFRPSALPKAASLPPIGALFDP